MEKIPAKPRGKADASMVPLTSSRAAPYRAIGPSVKAAKAGKAPTRARVVTVMPLDVAQALDRLAAERYAGNRSAALAGAVRLAVAVFKHEANRGRLVRDERDALRAIVEADGASV